VRDVNLLRPSFRAVENEGNGDWPRRFFAKYMRQLIKDTRGRAAEMMRLLIGLAQCTIFDDSRETCVPAGPGAERSSAWPRTATASRLTADMMTAIDERSTHEIGVEGTDGCLSQSRMADGVRMLIVLPHQTVYLDYSGYARWPRIRDMTVRGAPAIGAAAAYGLALVATHSPAQEAAALLAELAEAAQVLRAARPTAVNLFWAIDRVMRRVADPGLATLDAIRAAVLDEAHAIANEDVRTNKQIGLNALPLVPDKANIIHHCNTGSRRRWTLAGPASPHRTVRQAGACLWTKPAACQMRA
jgi:hypothetical protein